MTLATCAASSSLIPIKQRNEYRVAAMAWLFPIGLAPYVPYWALQIHQAYSGHILPWLSWTSSLSGSFWSCFVRGPWVWNSLPLVLLPLPRTHSNIPSTTQVCTILPRWGWSASEQFPWIGAMYIFYLWFSSATNKQRLLVAERSSWLRRIRGRSRR